MISNKRLKILFLPKWYPNRFDALDGIFVVDHVKAVAKYHDVRVLYIHSDSELNQRKKIIINKGVGYEEITIYFRYRKTGIKVLDKAIIGIRYLRTQFKAYRSLKKDWGKPDLLHVHILLRSSLLALREKWFRKIQYVVTEHWSGYDPKTPYKISRLKKAGMRIVLKNASVTTAVSHYLISHLKSIYANVRYEFVSNAIDETLFIQHERLESKIKKLIHVSTLDDYPKNFGMILRAIADVSKEHSEFEMYVIGKGPEREKQEALASELGILDRTVFFRGYLPKEEVAKVMASSDLLILYSQFETQSCVVLESLLCGIPVIVPRVGGVQELVNDDNGILVDPNDQEKLKEAIMTFLNGENLFDNVKIREHAIRYSHSAVGGDFDRIYRSILNE